MRSLKSLTYVLPIVVAAALQLSPAWAADDLPQIQQQGDISYLSGGIGKDESNALEAVQHNYNLRILSADKAGHYSGDTRVVVSDREHRVLLDTTGGPLFYTNLPDGRYNVEGFDDGQSRKQAITIAGGRPVSVHFTWRQNFAEAATNY